MTTQSNRVHKKSNTNGTISQAQPSAPRPAGNGSICSRALQNLAGPVQSALDELERAASSVAALCVMNGWLLGDKIHGLTPKNDKDGYWETFSKLELHGGISSMALEMVKQFKQDLAGWREYQLTVLGGKGRQSPKRWDLENSISALNYLVPTQSDVLASHYCSSEDENAGAIQCASLVLDQLNTAWRQSTELWRAMMQIIESTTVAVQLKAA